MLVTSVSAASASVSISLVLSSTTSVLSIVSVVVSAISTCADSTAVGMDSVVAVVSYFPQETKDKMHIVISAKIIFLFTVYSSLYKINLYPLYHVFLCFGYKQNDVIALNTALENTQIRH